MGQRGKKINKIFRTVVILKKNFYLCTRINSALSTLIFKGVSKNPKSIYIVR